MNVIELENKTKKISLICPVYNCEAFLKKLLEVLAKQTCNFFQLIIVDDCSTDHSSQIIDDYSALFEDIIIIKNAVNRGVSYSRNVGLEQVKGDYVVFIDADDLIDTTYIENIYKGLRRVKDDWCILYFTAYKFFNEIESHSLFLDTNFKIKNKDSLMKMILDDRFLGGYLFNKVFRASVIKEKNIKFDEEIFISEDMLFCTKYASECYNSKAYSITNNYYYRENPSSVTHTLSLKKLDNMVEAKKRCINVINIKGVQKLADAKYILGQMILSYYRPELKLKKKEVIRRILLLFWRHISFKKKCQYIAYLLSYRISKFIYLRFFSDQLA